MTPDEIIAEMERWTQEAYTIRHGSQANMVARYALIDHMREWFNKQLRQQAIDELVAHTEDLGI